MDEPVSPTYPTQPNPTPVNSTNGAMGADTPTPAAPTFENNPTPTDPIAAPTSPTPNDNYNTPAPILEPTTSTTQFANNGNFAHPFSDQSILVGGETNFAPSEGMGGGVTTATILPGNPEGTDMVSYPSSGGGRRFILPAIVGALLFLALIAGGIIFFRQQGTSNAPVNTNTQPTPTATPTVEHSTLPTTTYQNNEFNFTIDYPQSWNKKEAALGNIVTFTDPSSPPSNPSRIGIRDESTTKDLKTYVEGLNKLSGQLYTGLTSVNSTPTTIGSLAATQLENTYVKGSNTIHMLQLVVLKGGKAFTVTAETEESSFTTLKPTLTQVFASLNFKD